MGIGSYKLSADLIVIYLVYLNSICTFEVLDSLCFGPSLIERVYLVVDMHTENTTS